MNKVIIFDFNRTLFNPDTQGLIEGAREVLDDAKQKGYTLVLLATAKPSRRELIAELGLARYFAEIMLVQAKSGRMFRNIAKQYNADPSRSFVIGDRAHGEIKHGHRAGWHTIWLRAGKFAAEKPEGFLPDHTIASLIKIKNLI